MCVSKWRIINTQWICILSPVPCRSSVPMASELTAVQTLKVLFSSGTEDQWCLWKCLRGASDWPVFLSYFAETLVSFELELAVYIYVPNLPSLVWTLYSAPSKPLLEAEPLTSSPCSQEPQKLLGITQTGLPQKVAPRSPSPDKQSPKLLRSLLLEFFNGVINLLLIFGIILIKTVLCMYY